MFSLSLSGGCKWLLGQNTDSYCVTSTMLDEKAAGCVQQIVECVSVS